MPKKRKSIFNESKDKFIGRKSLTSVREILTEDPLLAANRETSCGNLFSCPYFF